VENAIKHGLEPQREGGHIDVIVSRRECEGRDQICVQVRDNGRGLAHEPVQTGGGVGLTNLRERLNALYGAQASFTLESNDGPGVVATLCVPPLPAQATIEPAAPAPGSASAQALRGGPALDWQRVRSLTAKTHSVWSGVLARVFMVLMVLLLAALAVAFVALYTGWLPVMFGDLQVDGIEGLAMGSVGLLVAFGITVFAAAVLVAVLYGLGWLIAALLILIPGIALIANIPTLAVVLAIGFVGYTLWKRRNP